MILLSIEVSFPQPVRLSEPVWSSNLNDVSVRFRHGTASSKWAVHVTGTNMGGELGLRCCAPSSTVAFDVVISRV